MPSWARSPIELLVELLRRKVGRRRARPPPSEWGLLQQLQDELLLLVGLGQSRNAGLFQDGIFCQVSNNGRNIGSVDGVFRRRQVDDLAVEHVAGGGEAVDGCAQGTAYAGNVGNGRTDQSKRGLGIGLGQDVGSSLIQVHGSAAGTVGDPRRGQRSKTHSNLARSDGGVVTQKDVGGGGGSGGGVGESSQHRLGVGGTHCNVVVVPRVGDHQLTRSGTGCPDIRLQASRICQRIVDGTEQRPNRRA